MSSSITVHSLRALLVAFLAIGACASRATSQIVRQARPICTHFAARNTSLMHGETITAQFSNYGTLSSPGNDSTDIRWQGLGYGYEFGFFVGAEVPGKGTHGLGRVKTDQDGNVQRDMTGDTLWARHIVSDGLLTHGGERSPNRREWWGWEPVECAEQSGGPTTSVSTCFPNASVDEVFTMNDLANREFDYYPLQGDSTWQGLGLQVRARYVQAADSTLRDVVFLIYRIENRSRIDLDNVIVGMWGDPHIGGARNYADDLAAFRRDLGLVEVWDADGVADTPDLTPGYFGYLFLEGPAGLTSLSAIPFQEVNASDDEQLWDLVRPGRFDPMPARPGDDVYLVGSGPTRLRVGRSIQFAVALLLAQDASGLQAKAARAREVFDRECAAHGDM